MRAIALGTSAIALCWSFGAAAQPVEEVVVTGSHIRGVAPVGSTIVSVGSEDFAKTGAADVYTLLKKVPQLLGLGLTSNNVNGGANLQASAGNISFNNSINLRGVSTVATLVLVNGQRQVPGNLGTIVDPDNYPTSLIQRVDVQADGTSAIYGSDAIAGTVNFILREPEDVVETGGQITFKVGNSIDWMTNVTVGTTWDASSSGLGDGGIILTAQHQWTDGIAASMLPHIYRDDLTAYYPSGLMPTTSTPANVRGFGATAAEQAVLYAVPATGIGPTQGLLLSQLGPANQPNRTSAYTGVQNMLPEVGKTTFAGNFKQELASWLRMSAFGQYNKRSGVSIFAFGAQLGSAMSVPATNPYSPCAPGRSTANTQGLVCPATPLIVPYTLVNEYMHSSTRSTTETLYSHSASFEIDLPYEWQAVLSESFGKNYSNSHFDSLNTTALNQVLSGVGKPANVPFLNPFCSNTTAPCNSPLTIAYILADNAQTLQNWLWDTEANFNGPLFTLPGGDVRLAVGGAYTEQSLSVFNYAANTPAVGTYVVNNNTELTRQSTAVYGELYVPIVGADNAMPGIQKLELTAAVRHTTYSRPKVNTTDPKFGVNWTPIDELKIRGAYGTSFRAPNLRELNPGAAAAIMVNNTTCGSYTGIVCPSAGTALSPAYFNGGNPAVKPETAKSWTVGADWSPDYIPGLTASVTWYKLAYRDLIRTPGSSFFPLAVANAGIFDDIVVFNPTYFPTRARVNTTYLSIIPTATRGAALSQANYDAFVTALSSLPQYQAFTFGANPAPFIADGRFYNTGQLNTDGFDFQVNYAFDTEWGNAHVGVLGTYVTSYEVEQVTGGGIVQRGNHFGYTTRLRGRAEFGLEKDGWNATVYVNYTNPYQSDPSFVPAAAIAANPDFLNIEADTTVDLSLGYDTRDEIAQPLLRNINLQLVVTNLFDKDPPFFINAAAPIPVLFDPQVASPLGRLITLRVNKKW